MSHGFQKIHLSDDDQHANSYNRPNFKDRKSFLKITGFCLGFLFAFSIVFYQYDPAFRMGNALSLISEPTLVTTGTDSESEGVSRPSHGTVRIETLDPALLPSPETKGGKAQRLVVVGDVHGCIEELNQLLKRASFNPQHDHLILVGDLLAKGKSDNDLKYYTKAAKASKAVIGRVRELNGSCVRGNHEENLLRAAKFKKGSVKGDIAPFTISDLEYIASWPHVLRLGQLPLPHSKSKHASVETVVVHAGLLPGIPLKLQTPYDVTDMRVIVLPSPFSAERKKKKKHKNSKMYSSPDRNEKGGQPWYEVWEDDMDRRMSAAESEDATSEKQPKADATDAKDLKLRVLYGHDARIGVRKSKWSYGLDGNCTKGGSLNGLVINADGEELISVDCVGKKEMNDS